MKALAISGGGSKGAFAVGVLKKLIQQDGNQYDIFAGTSTGALIIPLAATGDINTLVDIYTNVNTADLLTTSEVLDNFMHRDSLYKVDRLKDKVDEYVNQARYDTIMASGKLMMFCAVCLQTADIVYFTNKDANDDGDFKIIRLDSREAWIRAIMASSDQPVFMPPIDVTRTLPVRQYIDGGVREYAPIRGALYNGATEIDLIVHATKKYNPKNKRFDNVLDILTQTIDLLTEDVAVTDLQIGGLLGKNEFANVTINLYRPQEPLPITNSLKFDKDEMKKCLELGEAAAANPEKF